MDPDGTFGSLLRRHRLAANLTQAALAARSGMSLAAISMLERGARQTPRRSTLESLSRALRLPLDIRDVFLAAAEPPSPVRAHRDQRPAPAVYPPNVAADWREAHGALAAGLPRAAAGMARRAVYGVCVDRGVVGGARLCELIEKLGEVSTLHPTLVEWARQIRIFGSTVANAVADGLDSITREEATGVVAFLDELLLVTYEVPDRLSRLKARTTP
jgi:transcriptional regulator with XRE-family HTH domain